MIANVAVSVIIAALTGGTAGPVLLAQLARAAAAMAVAKVLIEKVIRGDRFDIIGADGAVAFATGAVEGVMNVAGGLAAKGVTGAGLEAVGLSAQQASGSLFRGAARDGLLAVTEGTIAGGSTSMVDTMARDETWREGIGAGLERVAESTATGAATGGAMALSLHTALRGFRAVRAALGEDLPLAHPENPLVGRAIAGEEVALRKIVSRMDRWEVGMRELASGDSGGIGAGLPQNIRDQLVAKLGAHREAIVEHLNRTFNAARVEGSSREPGSDVDLNVRGDDAGTKLIQAEQYMDSAYPNWRTHYRMGLLVDAEPDRNRRAGHGRPAGGRPGPRARTRHAGDRDARLRAPPAPRRGRRARRDGGRSAGRRRRRARSASSRRSATARRLQMRNAGAARGRPADGGAARPRPIRCSSSSSPSA